MNGSKNERYLCAKRHPKMQKKHHLTSLEKRRRNLPGRRGDRPREAKAPEAVAVAGLVEVTERRPAVGRVAAPSAIAPLMSALVVAIAREGLEFGWARARALLLTEAPCPVFRCKTAGFHRAEASPLTHRHRSREWKTWRGKTGFVSGDTAGGRICGESTGRN